MDYGRVFPPQPVTGYSNKGGWSGEVDTYADLPSAVERPGRVFLVRESSGFMWAHRKGLYRSDGNTWARLSNSIFEILDTEAIIRDNVDPSKCLRFELEDLSANTTRTLRFCKKHKRGMTVALQKDFETRAGTQGNYINFDVSIQNKTEVTLVINFWKDMATRNTEGMIPLNNGLDGSRFSLIIGFDTIYEFTLDLNSVDNLYKQGYDYLKTLPEFQGALDA